jgi:HEAT repeat protein
LLVLAGLVGLAAQGPVRAQRGKDTAVEQFRQALILERNDKHTFKMSDEAIDKAVAFRKKNLEEAASQLKRPNQLAAALLLSEWPLETALPLKGTYEDAAARVEKEVRDKMVDRLIIEARRAFTKGPPALQVAVATLVGEMVSALAGDLGEEAREKLRSRELSKGLGKDPTGKPRDAARGLLYNKLLDLAEDLKKLAGSSSPAVRTATARALSQFSKKPDIAATTLRSLLAPSSSNPAPTRREAANALLTMVQAVSGTEPERSSEPGVSIRETKRTRPLFTDNDQVAVISAVIPVAAQGVGDSDPVVRRTCTAAVHESVAALFQVIRGLVELFQRPGGASFTAEFSFPPPDREWSADEKKAVERGRQFVWEREKNLLKPALLALTQAPSRGDLTLQEALTRSAFDSDPEARLNARRALDRLALVRAALRDLRQAVPTQDRPGGKNGKKEEKKDDKKKDKDRKGKDRDVRAVPASGRSPARIVLTSGQVGPPSPPPLLHLPTPEAITVHQKDEPDRKDKKDDKKDEDKDEEEPLPREPDKEVDKARRDLGRMLRGIGGEMVRRGYVDPNAPARRSSFQAVEGLGEAAIPFVPQIVRASKDRDLFVRWIAARTLGKLGQQPSKLSQKQTDLVLEALGRLLGDDDLDVRIAAAKAIELFGPAAAPVVPVLTQRVNRGDAEFRIAVIRALEEIGPAARAALPAIARELRQIDPRLRAEAARSLGRFGAAAGRPYLRELTRLNNDPDSEVRRAASSAIINILGK